jgi:MFS family permease
MSTASPSPAAKRLSFRILFLQYFGFMTIGLALSLFGPLIPLIQKDWGVSYGLAGILFPAQAAGSLTVLLLSSLLIHILEKRKVLLVGCAVFIAGLLCAALAPGFPLLLLGNMLLGAGVATFEVGFNTLCIDSHPQGKGKALNRLHFFFGVGAVAGPLIALAVETFGSGVDWRWALGLAAIGPAVVLAVLCFTPLPPSPPAEPKKRFAVYTRPLLWLSAVVLCLYCGVELGVGNWLSSFWHATTLAAIIHPAIVTSLFWLTFSIGRFVVGTWADRWGFRRFLLVSMLTTLAIIILWFFIPAPALALVLVMGLGFIISGIYPTTVALAAHKFPSSSGQVAGFLSVFGVLGGAIFPSAIGFWADYAGIQALVGAEVILAAAMLGVAVLAILADRKQAAV